MALKSLVLLFLSFFSPWLAAVGLGLLSPEQLQVMQQEQHALVVDVRTAPEWHNTGIIPDSVTLQSFNAEGKFDGPQWLSALQKLKARPDQPVILVCRSGNRSAKVGQFLLEQGVPNVYHLQNGIQGWIKSGHAVKSE